MEINLASSEDEKDESENGVESKVLLILQQFVKVEYHNGDVSFKDDGLLDSIKMLRFLCGYKIRLI